MYLPSIPDLLLVFLIVLGVLFGWKRKMWISLPAAVVCIAASFFFAELTDTRNQFWNWTAVEIVQLLRCFSIGIVLANFFKVWRF
jgi:hypothetical protein